MNRSKFFPDGVQIWLWVGLVMIFIQILLGGITRLTGSGLSITKWEIVTGIWFPMDETSWNREFDLYKNTPQFQKINADFSLHEFKFIYFWEYFHRLWARLMGFVFVIPYIFFWVQNKLDKGLKKELILLVLLASSVAALGWIMVASGLIHRPWVNAYKLSFHLSLAVITLAFLAKIIFSRIKEIEISWVSRKEYRLFGFIFSLCFIQIFFGGIMAGMKAAIVAPTWPTINTHWIPPEVFQWSLYPEYVFNEYEQSHVGPVIIQFWHRLLAYLLFCLILISVLPWLKQNRRELRPWGIFLLGIILSQLCLGILTLWNSVGAIPIWYAVSHQWVGIFLWIVVLFLYKFKLKPVKN